MAAEGVFCTPEKKCGLEMETNDDSVPAVTTASTKAERVASCGSTSSSHTATTTQSSSCLNEKQKDTIIAQILAGEDDEFQETTAGLCNESVFFEDNCYLTETPQANWTAALATSHQRVVSLHPSRQILMSSTSAKDSRSLLVTKEARGGSLRQSIEKVVFEHELVICNPIDATRLCNERTYQLIWVQLLRSPSDNILSVVSAIRYSSKCNRKSVILGVINGKPEIDLHLHGIDEVLLEPVSTSTIRQKYFDWTSVRVVSGYELEHKESTFNPATPDSSLSTESSVELSLSSIASDTTIDSGIHGDEDMIDMSQSPSFAFSTQQGMQISLAQHTKERKFRLDVSTDIPSSPTTPPTWCRGEHATKEKHRRERIKDSCDQLRVLLPYVRGRKTDMASILEMTVHYLKVIISKLPQEFHAYALDVMTKETSPSAYSSARTSLADGRSSTGRGGRGRGGRRSVPTAKSDQNNSASEKTDFMCSSSTSRGRMSRSLSRIASSSSGSRTGCQHEDASPSSSMQVHVPTFIQPRHPAATLVFANPPSNPPSSSVIPSSAASSLGMALTPSSSLTSKAPSTALALGDFSGLVPAGHLYPPTHLAMEHFAAHNALAVSSAVGPSLNACLSLVAADRDGSNGSGLSFSGSTLYGEPALFHYYSGLSDLGAVYTVASGAGGGGSCNAGSIGGQSVYSDYMASVSTLQQSVGSAFTARGSLAASGRSKIEQPDSSLTSGEGVCGAVVSNVKTTN